MQRSIALLAAPVALAVIALAGCGESGASSSEPAPAPAETASATDTAGGSSGSAADDDASGGAARPTTPAEAVTRESGRAVVRLTGDDNMQYNVGSFAVRPGEVVELVLAHVGEQSVEAMGHNVVVLKDPDASAMSFAIACQSEGGKIENDYLPKALRDRVLAHTDMLGGGEEDRVTFTAPEKPGKYPFVCTFPGHAPTMNGEMKVAGR